MNLTPPLLTPQVCLRGVGVVGVSGGAACVVRRAVVSYLRPIDALEVLSHSPAHARLHGLLSDDAAVTAAVLALAQALALVRAALTPQDEMVSGTRGGVGQ